MFSNEALAVWVVETDRRSWPRRADNVHMASTTTRTYADALAAARSRDGGFALARGGHSETEPTAVAALALDDPVARAWLARAQRRDGGFAAADGRPESPSVAALAALALADDPGSSSRAFAHALANRASTVGESGSGDQNGRDGWGWTNDTYAWVEPTSRILLATKVLRAGDSATRAEALRILRERQCVDGGWNYGNTSVKGVDLRGYAQTTAVALMALQGDAPSLVDPGLRFLEKRWRDEPGGLTLAQSAVALDLHRADGVGELHAALGATFHKTEFLGNVLTLGWAALASAPSAVNRLRIES